MTIQRKSLTTLVIAIITGLAIITCLYLLHVSYIGSSYNEDANLDVPKMALAAHEPGDFDQPTRLIIPSISIDAKIQVTGLTASGNMGIPTNFTDVAWFKYGAIPGKAGNALIDGHVDNALGLKGVFKNLKNIKEGEDIYVIDKKGTKIRFRAISIVKYPYDNVPVADIFGPSDKPYIRLITCGGSWIKSAKTYDTRVVVTGEFIDSTPKE